MTDPVQGMLDWINKTDQILDEIAKFHANQFCSASELRANLENLKTDYSDKSLEEIYEIAGNLFAPGSIHIAGALIHDVMRFVFCPNPFLVAATLRLTWKGGKMGFVFLPDPAEADMEDYSDEADSLLDALTDSWMADTSYLLANGEEGQDLDFYKSLPKHMTVYRGGHGITPERLAAGVCWTRSRSVAEWFAHRGFGQEPVVVSSRISQHDIATVFASEFEVVCRPYRFRTLKCRSTSLSRKPKMEWTEDDLRP